jgi:hypothetical protein
MRQQREIDSGKDRLSKGSEMLSRRRDGIIAAEQALERQRTRVDATSRKSVDGFNAAITAHSKAVNDFNNAVNKYNADTAHIDLVVNLFNRNCAAHSYYQDDADADAIQAELALDRPAVSTSAAGAAGDSAQPPTRSPPEPVR